MQAGNNAAAVIGQKKKIGNWHAKINMEVI